MENGTAREGPGHSTIGGISNNGCGDLHFFSGRHRGLIGHHGYAHTGDLGDRSDRTRAAATATAYVTDGQDNGQHTQKWLAILGAHGFIAPVL